MSEKGRVLIIDDEALIRLAMADFLVDCGYTTVTAEDGAQGLEKARAESFDVVLVDLRMPNVDGLAVIEALNDEQPDLPIVVVSGTGVLDDAIEAMRRGAWDYITKPVQDIEEIRVIVERVIERAQLLAERDRYHQELERLNRSLEAEVAHQTHDLRLQNRELMALNQVSYAISDPLDLHTMLDRALDAAVEAIGADAGVVRLLDLPNDRLIVAAAHGFPETYSTSSQAVPMGQGVIGQVARDSQPRSGGDFSSDPWLAPLAVQGFQAYLCVPLRAGKSRAGTPSVLGVLAVFVQNRRVFDTHEIDLLANIGNQIGVAVARGQYAADLRRSNIQLEQANVELRELDRLREQFIQNVAHELRTPLALVRGYVEMLVAGGLGEEERQAALEVTSRRVETLVDLVESVTTLQDLGSQPLNLEEVSSDELVKTATQMTAQRAVSAGIELEYDCQTDLPTLYGDFTRLSQALHQLLDNACKFSPEGAKVTVSAWQEPQADVMCISVTDQGIGIPVEEQTRIFDQFYQVNGGLTRQYGGTGLGLALVREIIEAHGGEVLVESQVNQGSRFTVCLPLRK